MSAFRRLGDDKDNYHHQPLTPPSSTYQRTFPLPPPSPYSSNQANPHQEWSSHDVEMVSVPPNGATSGGQSPRESWPLNQDSRAPPSVNAGWDERERDRDRRDEAYGLHPASRRASSIIQDDPPHMRPTLKRYSYNRSLADWSAESPPDTPRYGSRAPSVNSWRPNHARSESPSGQSWMPRGGANSPYASGRNSPVPFRSTDQIRPLYPDAPTHFFDKEWLREGSIAKIHERDDVEHLSGFKRRLFFLAPILALLTLASYWVYFTLRIICVISAQNQLGRAFPLAWVFIAVEISVAIPVFMQTFWSVFILKKRKRPKYRLVGNDVPPIDVFITCCGEDVDLVLDTVRATCDVDYPPDKFRVIVLDDAKDSELAKACYGLANDRYHNLHYRARTKIPGVPHHFKAGNLNYGLEEVCSMSGGAAPYVAALDADMIPEQHWLRAIMPHMLIDPKMALACPPQLFYNVPPSDPLCQSLDFFVHVSEPIKDALGVAWCTGSGYILRREALEEIGMFPKGSLAEDVATSTMMLGKGWHTAYIHEPLQFGTVPDSYGSHLKQRTRWAIGTVDTSFKLKFCLYGDAVRHMTFYQRMSSFIYAVLSLFNIVLTLSLFAMPVVLITGNALVAYANDEQLRWLIRACFAAFILNRLCEFILFIPAGYNCGQRGSRAQLWMSPYIALTILRSFVLPTWLGGQTQAFKPSGSLKSELNERDPVQRANLFRRFFTIVVNYLAGYHILYVYFCLTAVTLTTIRCIVDQYTIKDQLVCMLTHAFWPPLSWIMVCSAFWVPVTYALDPPSMPDREALLNRDPKTGIAHPTKESKKTAFKSQTALFEIEYFITTAFTTVVFAAAFFY